MLAEHNGHFQTELDGHSSTGCSDSCCGSVVNVASVKMAPIKGPEVDTEQEMVWG